MNPNFLKLPNGSVVNIEQLLVVAHTGVSQYALVFKGSNQGITIGPDDVEALLAHLEPYEMKKKEEPIVIATEVQASNS